MGKIGLILGILNTLAIGGVLGLYVYTQVMFQRPPITETQERQKLEKESEMPAHGATSAHHAVMVTLPAITSNLDPYEDQNGKKRNHLVTMTITLEVANEAAQAKIDLAKPVIMDRILQNLAKKKYKDLNQVQGRYVFRSQIIDGANEFIGETAVTDVFFSDFLLQ